jgi:hypothetical protein
MSSLGRGLYEEAEQRGEAPVVADLPASRPVSPNPLADLVFSGTLYVDMISEQVPVPWGSFSSAEGESARLCPGDIGPSPLRSTAAKRQVNPRPTSDTRPGVHYAAQGSEDKPTDAPRKVDARISDASHDRRAADAIDVAAVPLLHRKNQSIDEWAKRSTSGP